MHARRGRKEKFDARRKGRSRQREKAKGHQGVKWVEEGGGGNGGIVFFVKVCQSPKASVEDLKAIEDGRKRKPVWNRIITEKKGEGCGQRKRRGKKKGGESVSQGLNRISQLYLFCSVWSRKVLFNA